MQWHEPRFAELGQPDRQHARVEVDVVTLEPRHLGQKAVVASRSDEKGVSMVA